MGAFILVSVLITLLLLLTIATFSIEKEWRAVMVTVVLALFCFLLFGVLLYLNQLNYYLVFCATTGFLIVVLFLPIKSKKVYQKIDKDIQHDERDIMFSRNELKVDSERFTTYYKANPQNLQADNKFRKEPGLLSDNSLFYHPKAFNAAQSCFEKIEEYHSCINDKPSENTTKTKPILKSQELKQLAISMGALDLGITELKPHHVYSHKGRREEYGKQISNNHKYAIAFTVEMAHAMVQAAPKASIVMESAKQYLHSAEIAVTLADHIRQLGYEARAHIDGNYQVICPLVAHDAGLGEIGRMGLLMTPKHGPRARIAVVTTNMPFVTNKKLKLKSVEQFCYYCKKCAVCCPSQSIMHNKPMVENGSLKWKINSESCFTYWCKVGTDCGRCMAVCPYSHPNTILHRFIRWGIKNNYIFLRLAVYFDDLFYGRKPKSKKLPDCLN